MCAGVVERGGLKNRYCNNLVGANPIICTIGYITQLVECETVNLKVVGSIPTIAV